MKLNQLLENNDTGCVFAGPGSADLIEISSIETDNRKCGPGSLFVCIRGYVTDGHRYAAAAAAAGAEQGGPGGIRLCSGGKRTGRDSVPGYPMGFIGNLRRILRKPLRTPSADWRDWYKRKNVYNLYDPLRLSVGGL